MTGKVAFSSPYNTSTVHKIFINQQPRPDWTCFSYETTTNVRHGQLNNESTPSPWHIRPWLAFNPTDWYSAAERCETGSRAPRGTFRSEMRRVYRVRWSVTCHYLPHLLSDSMDSSRIVSPTTTTSQQHRTIRYLMADAHENSIIITRRRYNMSKHHN